MMRALPSGLTDCLLWSDELGMGWHTREPMSYDGDYFAKYQELDATPMGEALTKARIDFVAKYIEPSGVVDIGIGGGRFVMESGGWGYDVSKQANKWLKSIHRWRKPGDEWHHPGKRKVEAITCWDSIEHIPEPEALLENVTGWLFVSMPTYKSQADCLKSKHYKPGEHLWYFTIEGFTRWAAKQGFELMEINHAESELGREGITSFAFRRIDG